jgi:hypothetical protein
MPPDRDATGAGGAAKVRRELPVGYRPGVISAITVILGFSLLFLRYWTFEAEGQWTRLSIVAAASLSLSILVQIFSLWRALQVSDDDVDEYAKTLRWFFSAIMILLVSVLLAAFAFADVSPF